jgi:carnitine O-palmitoyltransferase 2
MFACRVPVRCKLAGKSISTATNQHCCERYIQTTRVPTLHFQPSLPRLPIPKLEDTCSRYLDALTPVTSDEQLSRTRSIVAEFRRAGGEGEILDKRLRQLDSQNKHTSYVSAPWYRMYLTARDALVLNYNPFMAWKQDLHITDQVCCIMW